MTDCINSNGDAIDIPCLKRIFAIPAMHFYLFGVCLLLTACSATQPPVPVVDRIKNQAPESAKPMVNNGANSQVYIVQKGDTLSAIALNHGIDYKKLIEWNDIADPNSIKPGQKINLSTTNPKESKPTLYAVPQQPVTTTLDPESQAPELAQTAPQLPTNSTAMNSNKFKTGPKALKLPFSEQNIARLQQQPSGNFPGVTQAAPAAPVGGHNATIETSEQTEFPNDKVSDHAMTDWMWPTNGKVMSSFSKNSKGVKISGQAGQPVVASAAGVVVYSGSGLRGYGNLIIIKHDETFLSAYAHNNKLLVKEGEAVVKGQKIAEMGNTDSDTVQLHFEIRKNSKPVDPLQYLPHQS